MKFNSWMKEESLSCLSTLMVSAISYFKSGVSFRLTNKKTLSSWIYKVALREGYKIESIVFVFCSDNALLKMNKDFLNHNYYTDILTFDLSEKKNNLFGEIYISTDRVIENALRFKTTFKKELSRVMIHGILHLMGYDDKTPSKAQKMRLKEDTCLSLLK